MNTEKRTLPEIDILGTIFQFDIDRIALIEKGDPANFIYFDSMDDYGTHYEFLYNNRHKNYSHIGNIEIDDPFDGHLTIREENNETVFQVSIPRISELDPEGMMRKYGCSSDDLKNRTDFEIIVDQDVYRRRMAGEVVTINIGSQIFEVDVFKNSLHSLDNPENDIHLAYYYYDYFIDDDDSYYLYFNMENNQIVDVLYDQTVKNFIVYKIPMISNLDPLAIINGCESNGKLQLFYHDLKMEHTAEATEQMIDVKTLLDKEFELARLDIPTSVPIYDNDERFAWKEYRNHLIADYKDGNLTIVYEKLKFSYGFKIITPLFPEHQKSGKKTQFGVSEAIKHIDLIMDEPSIINENQLNSKLLTTREYLKLYHFRKPKETKKVRISPRANEIMSHKKRNGPKI